MPEKEGIFVIIEYDPDNIEDYKEVSLIYEDLDDCDYTAYVKIFTTYESAVKFIDKETSKHSSRKHKIVELTV